MEGQIIKALSGFYYVKTKEQRIYQTRARGNFRKQHLTPLVGDTVLFSSENEKEGYLLEIKKRNNTLTRPPVANVSLGVIVMSAKDPDFSYTLLDRFLAHLEYFHIKGLLYLTKMDMLDEKERSFFEQVKKEYEKIGYSVILGNQRNSLAQLFPYFSQKLTVFIGQSGAGKSTLLNQLMPELKLKTDAISKSLGRGKHTTRHVELHEIANGLVADTPGFSALDFPYELKVEQLSSLFKEIDEASQCCKFRQCLHLKEPGCAVKMLLEEKKLLESRYQSYVQFVTELQNRKPLYKRKKESL